VDLELTFASALYDRMQAIYTGEVTPAGIKLVFIPIDEPRNIFDRMAGGLEFDVAEYSLSEYMQRYANDQCPFVAIPAFPSRSFRHGFISVRRGSGINEPADLAGKRIGVPLYTMTAAVFIRGLLRDEYGVDFSDVRWVEGAMNTPGSHGSPTVLPLLRGANIESVPSGKSLNDLMIEGEIDATIGSSIPNAVGDHPDVIRLFPDFVDREKDYYRRTNVFPIMHTVAIRKELHERYPFVASSMYTALDASKNIALQKMKNHRALRYMLPWLPRDIDEIDEVFGGDPWPYGVAPNRPTLEALSRYLVADSMIEKPVEIDGLFAAVY
jgi:4,5-dihydroxyphthalate decarboxylase